MLKIIGLGLAAGMLAGCGSIDISLGPQTVGSGVLKTEARNLEGFRKISLNGSPTVIIAIGKGYKVEVTTDDNLLEKLETKVSGDTLEVGFKGNVSTKSEPKVVITMPALESATVNGSGDVEISNLDQDKLSASIHGSGSISAKGSAKSLDGTVTGSGELELRELTADAAKIVVTGSGRVLLSEPKTLDATISGSGNITYRGKPELKESITGSGQLRSE
jgi:hypothetical protein